MTGSGGTTGRSGRVARSSRWPGQIIPSTGSTRAGRCWHPLPGPVTEHWWNRWGFWAIAWASDDPYVPLRYPGATASCWVAVPSWLVVLAGSLPWLRRWLTRRWLRTPRIR